MSISKVELRMVYFCHTSPITRSTCIFAFVYFLVVSMSIGDNCDFPFANAEILTSAHTLQALS